MFAFADNDILTLHDELLRELVGRLCEAELESLGLSPLHVHWGGDHKAADGGLDVTVRLPQDTQIKGFIPKRVTGFQVKKPAMQAAAIKKEMAPKGKVRDSICELARAGGAYVIVSATSSNTELAIAKRRAAMSEAVSGIRNKRKLLIDFYERGKLLSWVRVHPGVALWLASKIGKTVVGWRPHGAWAARPATSDPGFLVNKERRVYCEPAGEPLSDTDAIASIRAQLRNPCASVRLIGLSGVGKTRFAEQIFEATGSSDSLPRSQVFYADTSDDPDPPPLGMAERLIALDKPAFLVVDNCPPDLHRSLTNAAHRHASKLRLLTIEFDIRDDQAEGTQVVRLEKCDYATIHSLLHARFASLSGVDVQRVAEFADGNARLALVAAQSWMQGGPRSGMSDAELFRRIFAQRNADDDSLLKAAQAAALVYSFSIAPDRQESHRLATLCDMPDGDFTRRVAKLVDRGVAQTRHHWRAILPHAIANRLAAEALAAWPQEAIEGALVDLANPRLLTSFTKRLSYLHRSDIAVRLVKSWLALDGMLGRPETLDSLRAPLLKNVAPVCPCDTLLVLEEVRRRVSEDRAAEVWASHSDLLRLLAYDPDHFPSAARMLASAALFCKESTLSASSARALASLFYAYLSGTHASVAQRMACLQAVATTEHPAADSLALTCIDAALECDHFSSSFQFSFGATPRDYGYHPQSHEEVLGWFKAVIAKAIQLAARNDRKLAMRSIIAKRLPPLSRINGLEGDLVTLATSLAEGSYWPEGWRACRRALSRHRRLRPGSRKQLRALEKALSPGCLSERVQTFLVGDYFLDLLDEEKGEKGLQKADRRLNRAAAELGKRLAEDIETLRQLLPSLLRTGSRSLDLGRAMARRSGNADALWFLALEELSRIPEKERNYAFVMGILLGISETSRQQAEGLLDECVDHALMGIAFPKLQAVVGVRSADAPRVLRSIHSKRPQVGDFAQLAYGRALDDCGPAELGGIVLRLSEEPGGIDPALEILWMRLSRARREGEPVEAEIVAAGQQVLKLLLFDSAQCHDREYRITDVLEHCLVGAQSAAVAAQVARNVCQALVSRALWGDHARRIVKPLLEREPIASLDELLGGNDLETLGRRWDHFGERDSDPWLSVPTEVWKEWCDVDPTVRYPRAAAVVEPHGAGGDGSPRWSEVALLLLACAPNPEQVLRVFVTRFRPMSWSGSLTAIMERHLNLLELLDRRIVARMPDVIEQSCNHLRLEIASARRWEKTISRDVDGSFE